MNNIGIDRTLIGDKISLLHDFTILKNGYVNQEVSVCLLLGTLSEPQMERKLYNVLHGSETLKALIEREKQTIEKGVEPLSQSIASFLNYNNPEEIMYKLNNSDILKQVVITYYNMQLKPEETIDELRKELNI